MVLNDRKNVSGRKFCLEIVHRFWVKNSNKLITVTFLRTVIIINQKSCVQY